MNFQKTDPLFFVISIVPRSKLENILSKKITGPICILIGPEGDFSELERQLIVDQKQAFSMTWLKIFYVQKLPQ